MVLGLEQAKDGNRNNHPYNVSHECDHWLYVVFQ